VLSSDRRNRSKPAAKGGPILASHTAASRLMQQSGGAGDAAALVLAVQAFVANGGGRPAGCCIAGADGQSWPCRSAWLVTFPCRTVAGRSGQARGCRCFVKREVRFAPPGARFSRIAMVRDWRCGPARCLRTRPGSRRRTFTSHCLERRRPIRPDPVDRRWHGTAGTCGGTLSSRVPRNARHQHRLWAAGRDRELGHGRVC